MGKRKMETMETMVDLLGVIHAVGLPVLATLRLGKHAQSRPCRGDGVPDSDSRYWGIAERSAARHRRDHDERSAYQAGRICIKKRNKRRDGMAVDRMNGEGTDVGGGSRGIKTASRRCKDGGSQLSRMVRCSTKESQEAS